MRLKRFEGSSLAEALEKVRSECGEDALVVETRETQAGFAIVAAPPRNNLVMPRPDAGQRAAAALRNQPTSPDHPHTFSGAKRTLTDRLKPAPFTAGFTAIADAALRFGLSPRILHAIESALIGTRVELNKAGDPGLPTAAAKVLKALISCETIPSPHRVLALVGPTGVGKTTTLAKLAAKAAREEHESVAIISLDTYRIAAVEQLRAMSDMLQVPFEIAFTPLDLRRALKTFEDVDRVFIDTTGRGPFDSTAIAAMAGTLSIDKSIACALCLPAGMRYRDAKQAVAGFASAKPHNIILTKWDETDAAGEVLSLAIEREIRIAHVTIGQEVPDDILSADAGVLAASALNLSAEIAEKIL